MKVPVEYARGVDLNVASEEQLSIEVGLGPERAQRIVESRPFRDWEDIKSIEGFTDRLVDELQSCGARIGDPDKADVKRRSDEHRAREQFDKTARVDEQEGVPSDRSKGPQTEQS
jgi:hypothetical protein